MSVGRKGGVVKLNNLQPYKEPPPPERASCRACKTFAPECLVPVGDLAVPMCWLCAHHYVDHDVPLGQAHAAECDCMPHDIYPGRVAVPPEPEAPKPTLREIERDKLLNGPPQKLIAWAREAHKRMSLSQHAAVKKRLS